MITWRKLCALALVVAGVVGIPVQQIAGIANYPLIPPGMIVLVVGAAIVWFVPWRWAPIAGILVSLFMIIGLFGADQASRLVQVEETLDTVGLWIQMLSVVVALIAAVPAMARSAPAPSRPD